MGGLTQHAISMYFAGLGPLRGREGELKSNQLTCRPFTFRIDRIQYTHLTWSSIFYLLSFLFVFLKRDLYCTNEI